MPIEETMEVRNDLVKAGNVLYLGGSSMFAGQFAELKMTAQRHGWSKFISMQKHYNLIYREEEREMNPYCANSGVGLTPCSLLTRGILAGAYRGSFDAGSSKDITFRTDARLIRAAASRVENSWKKSANSLRKLTRSRADSLVVGLCLRAHFKAGVYELRSSLITDLSELPQ